LPGLRPGACGAGAEHGPPASHHPPLNSLAVPPPRIPTHPPLVSALSPPTLALRRAPRNCGRHGILIRPHGSAPIMVPARCMSWGCRRCAPALVRKWAQSFRSCDFAPTAFLTLTIAPDTFVEEEIGLLDYPAQHRWISRRLTAFYRHLRRRYAAKLGPLRYFRVFELHAGLWDPARKVHNHRLHVHLLVSGVPHAGFTTKTRIRYRRPDLQPYDRTRDDVADLAVHHGFGRSSCEGIVSDDAAQAYLHKYTCKQQNDAVQKYRIRFSSCSRCIRHGVRQFAGPITGDRAPLAWAPFEWCLDRRSPTFETKQPVFPPRRGIFFRWNPHDFQSPSICHTLRYRLQQFPLKLILAGLIPDLGWNPRLETLERDTEWRGKRPFGQDALLDRYLRNRGGRFLGRLLDSFPVPFVLE